MKKVITFFVCSSLLAFGAGCSSSDTPPAAVTQPLEPTLTNLVKEVINEKHCGGPLCHTLTAAGFMLGSKTALHDALVDQPAKGAKCSLSPDAGPGATPFTLVVPGKPDESLLYMKITGTQPCGDSMPNSSTKLSETEIALVHDWIAAGAKDD